MPHGFGRNVHVVELFSVCTLIKFHQWHDVSILHVAISSPGEKESFIFDMQVYGYLHLSSNTQYVHLLPGETVYLKLYCLLVFYRLAWVEREGDVHRVIGWYNLSLKIMM